MSKRMWEGLIYGLCIVIALSGILIIWLMYTTCRMAQEQLDNGDIFGSQKIHFRRLDRKPLEPLVRPR